MATAQDPSRKKEYAFEMASSSIRFGPGVTKEVGMDLKHLGVKRVCVVTDAVVRDLDVVRHVMEALGREDIESTIFDEVQIEPKDSSSVLSAIRDVAAFF